MKKLLILLVAILNLLLVGSAATNKIVLAYDPLAGACTAVSGAPANSSAGQPAACASDKASTDGSSIIAKVIKILSDIAGIAAVIMIIVAGLLFITSGGDAQSVANARRAILGAVIGLIIVVLAQGILLFIIDRAPHPAASSSSNSAGCTNTKGTKAQAC